METPRFHSGQAIARSATSRHTTIRIETDHPTEFIDLTERVQAAVAASGVRAGLVNIQTLHTTTAIVVNEHEPLLLADMAAMLERLAPQDAVYRHDNVSLRTTNCVLGERPNGHSHCRALLLAMSACLNVAGGRVQLGRWQRVFLVELDGPRTREVTVLILGDVAE
ncbi:MAG: YjbQ family protein [Acidimicrobiia bacterium]|nr:YjbQ family protein [Acidimicrobiia bacterium]